MIDVCSFAHKSGMVTRLLILKGLFAMLVAAATDVANCYDRATRVAVT